MRPFHQRRRWWMGVCAAVALAAPLLGAFAGAARAATPASLPGIDVVQVQGLVDPPNASLIRGAIDRAEHRHSTLLVFQLDSSGAVDVDVAALAKRIHEATVPIAVWIGPTGSTARGGAAVLAESAAVLSITPGSHVGPATPVRLDHPGDEIAPSVDAWIAANVPSSRQSATKRLFDGARLNADDAGASHTVDRVDNVLGDLVVGLDNKTVQTAAGARRLSTATVIGTGRGRRKQPNQDVRFSKLGLGDQLLHTLDGPWVAYMLFVAGLALLVFEFYTASIGLAGLVGALALVGGLTGFSHLPVQWWAVGLLMFGIFGFTVDVQAGTLGVWTGIGAAGLVAGSLTLYGGSSRLDPTWWSIVIVCGLTATFMVGGMTAMIRSRFATPTVGREGLVGEMGTAEVAVDPDGVVRLRGARWRARTNRATPIPAGDAIRVVAIDGLVLEVEPESGGAREIHT
ncbi:MAG TPA: NfeD family protein [Acidimicrobiia bacterium]|nr:NfeD family protein [Acidimicrobiia bacterium]